MGRGWQVGYLNSWKRSVCFMDTLVSVMRAVSLVTAALPVHSPCYFPGVLFSFSFLKQTVGFAGYQCFGVSPSGCSLAW
ncbi:hypothetical protein F4818DRAFT_397455 [Hypoxylon cercidicola]|nr:hypothetical protein F4818DRAFT_397455 [Hypoxylon cercidicola]